MQSATHDRPTDESGRLGAVQRYDILDTPPDGAFDRVTALAARICDVPISTITIVDEDRIWFKSAHGIDLDEIDREPGLCASAIMHPSAYIVADAVDDPRTLNNPLVRGELGLRFYVAIPLTTADGHRLGTLNVIDVEPREITEDEVHALEDLAAIVIDELELRLAARRTIQLEAAKEAAEFRASVLAGVSHEMRTRISVLSGMAGLEPLDPAEDRTMRDTMRRNVQQLDWLIHQYLDFTAIEAGRSPSIAPERHDPAELVRDAVTVFADDATISVDLEEPLPDVFADADVTRRIVVELINNAIRFAPSDSPVEVQVTAASDGTVGIAVVDHGPGIAAAETGRIFDKLYRSSESSGSGIGLYVARTLAEAQGGRIDVRSVPGAGSRFTLTVPTLGT
ncbi:MAG: GAF domain-containing sensor histidine kinase [Actinobacteria bacterium]|nr:GAF domain-containing sensor histidine kinase [Actinomycetota bacterium]